MSTSEQNQSEPQSPENEWQRADEYLAELRRDPELAAKATAEFFAALDQAEANGQALSLELRKPLPGVLQERFNW